MVSLACLEPVPPDWARVACWQGWCRDNPLDNAKRAVEIIQNAASAGVQLVVFPELFLHGYITSDSILKARSRKGKQQTDDSKALRLVGAAARSEGIAVAMGYAEREMYGKGMYNAVRVWHADGTVAFDYRKVSLYGKREQGLFLPGIPDDWKGFQLKMKGCEVRCGVCICYDASARAAVQAPPDLAADGVVLLLVPCAATNTGILEFFTCLRMDTVAFENKMIVLRANMGYDERYVRSPFCGKSSIADESGTILVMLGKDDDLLITQVQIKGTFASTSGYTMLQVAYYVYMYQVVFVVVALALAYL